MFLLRNILAFQNTKDAFCVTFLGHGDLLLMEGSVQRDFVHQVPQAPGVDRDFYFFDFSNNNTISDFDGMLFWIGSIIT